LSGALAASLTMAFAILGYAVLHAITRGMNTRGVVLAGVYATTLMFTWPLLAASILGLADTILNIRGRIAHKRGPPNLPT
jgi:hypothetical protein